MWKNFSNLKTFSLWIGLESVLVCCPTKHQSIVCRMWKRQATQTSLVGQYVCVHFCLLVLYYNILEKDLIPKLNVNVKNVNIKGVTNT